MRLELGHREAVVALALPLIDQAESELARLADQGGVSSGMDRIADPIARVGLACSSVPDFAALPALTDALVALLATSNPRAPELARRGLAALRQAVRALGTGSRAAERVPRLIQELVRVIGANISASVPRDAENAPEKKSEEAAIDGAASVLEQYRRAFLADDSGSLKAIQALAQEVLGPDAPRNAPRNVIDALFRHVHTVKGNAASFGLGTLAELAHELEDLLVRVRDGLQGPSSALDGSMGARIAALSRSLCEAFEVARSAHAAAAAAPRAGSTTAARVSLLSVTVGGREIFFPCDAVLEVLRAPRVFSAPRALSQGGPGLVLATRSSAQHGDGWPAGALVPLLDPAPLAAQPPAVGERLLRQPPWAVVMVGTGDGVRAAFCVPVDDIGPVVERRVA